METINNLKKIALGLAVLGLGMGFSAFTGEMEKKDISDNFLLQTSAGSFTRANVANGDCMGSSQLHCKYQVTAEGKANIDPASSYDADDIETFEQEGWIQPASDSSLGLYTP